MDEDEEYSDTREELLNRFRESLGKPMAERFFDEDDLIEIFDYAGDLNDDFLRMEVLLCGARFFPDSESLLERRGIFYSQYSDEAREQFLSHNPPDGNLILELLNLRAFPPETEEAPACLDSLLSANPTMGDEEIIQLVDLATSLQQFGWIKSHLDELRIRNDFANVLLFETAVAAENSGDNEYAAKLLEELTEIEPFNGYYWMMLARQYSELGQYDKGISAIDYSLAIKPDAPLSMLVKAKLLHSMDHPIEEIIELVQKALVANPADIDCLRFLVQLYNVTGKPAQARQLLEDALNDNLSTSEMSSRDRVLEIVPDLIMLDPENPDELFDQFFEACEDNNQVMWASWAQQLSMQGMTVMAKKCLDCYCRNTGQKIPSVFEIEDAFRNQEFERTIQAAEDYLKAISGNETDFPGVMGMHLISLLKLNDCEGALMLCDQITKQVKIDNYQAVNMRLEYIGLIALTHIVEMRIKKSKKTDTFDDFDPLAMWPLPNT